MSIRPVEFPSRRWWPSARRLKRQRGLDLLIVDYIQLLSGSAKNQGNRVQEITEITTGLKALAKELNVPIIALSQLSRQVESRDDKRPMMSDLRESGSIEQDADVVMFVFREEYYLSKTEPDEGSPEYEIWRDNMERLKGKAEVILAKQRHGPTGTAQLHFEGRIHALLRSGGRRSPAGALRVGLHFQAGLDH
jgi:replicative DNA helicase